MSMKDRKEAFENKFVHDADLRFKAEARRNKLLALWAAEKMGRTDQDAYVLEVIESDFAEAGDDDVMRKVQADFVEAGVTIPDADLRAKMDEFFVLAAEQVQSQ